MEGLLGVPVMATPGVTVTVIGTGDCVTGTAGVRGSVMTGPITTCCVGASVVTYV
jgi:hypothetical protein